MLYDWCNLYDVAHTCTELAGTTATGKTTDSQVCRNQTFWERRSCNWDYLHRCTGHTPGQCVGEYVKCLDGSSEIKEAQYGHCDREEVMCNARSLKRWDQNVCVKDQYKCDGVVHCQGNEDEAKCTEVTNSSCENKWVTGEGFDGDCDKAYKPIPRHCEKEEEVMCTARDGKFAGKKICVEKKFQCDNYVLCEDIRVRRKRTGRMRRSQQLKR